MAIEPHADLDVLGRDHEGIGVVAPDGSRSLTDTPGRLHPAGPLSSCHRIGSHFPVGLPHTLEHRRTEIKHPRLRTFPRCSPPRKHAVGLRTPIHTAHTHARTAHVRLPDSRPNRACQVIRLDHTSWMWIPGTTPTRNTRHAPLGVRMGGHGRANVCDSNNLGPWLVCFGLGISRICYCAVCHRPAWFSTGVPGHI
jgi:hypothetical protein